MVRVLKRTMVLDISGLPATLGRFEIAKAVDDLYCADFVVKIITVYAWQTPSCSF